MVARSRVLAPKSSKTASWREVFRIGWNFLRIVPVTGDVSGSGYRLPEKATDSGSADQRYYPKQSKGLTFESTESSCLMWVQY